MGSTYTPIKKRPKGYGAKPKTAAAALRQASRLLQEEGRWIQGSEIVIDDFGDLMTTDDPFCGSWGVCAIGALAAVTGDFTAYKSEWHESEFPNCVIAGGKTSQVYEAALEILDAVASRETYTSFSYSFGGEEFVFDGIVGYNDHTGRTRDEVVAKFDEAAKLAQRADRAARAARKKVLAGVGA